MSHVSRIAFDTEFIDAGCPIEDFDPNTNFDTTIGTYLTNYAITLACIIVAVLYFRKQSDGGSVRMCWFLVATAVSFLVAGVNHNISRKKDDPKKQWMELIAGLVIGAAATVLFDFGMYIIVNTLKVTSRAIQIVRLVLVIALSLIVIASTPVLGFLVVGVINILVYVFMIAIYSWVLFKGGCGIETCSRRSQLIGLKIVGLFLTIVSFVIYAVFSGMCESDEAYKNCFATCPFPNPAVFNHNGLFHVVFLVGVVLFSVVEGHMPSIDTTVDESQDEKSAGGLVGERQHLLSGAVP